jgi:hypothetical protein
MKRTISAERIVALLRWCEVSDEKLLLIIRMAEAIADDRHSGLLGMRHFFMASGTVDPGRVRLATKSIMADPPGPGDA